MTTERKDKLLMRRLGQNLRNQDWFAAGVELFVVVFGVFLGIQVANWNQERLQRDDERAILVRLHDETANLLETVRAEREDLQVQADGLLSAQTVLYSVEPERPLTSGECMAVVASHVYRKASDELPILEELLATGRFDRLQDADLKRDLLAYIMFRDRERGNHEERTNELFRLHSLHPDLITVGLMKQGDQDKPGSRFAMLTADGYQWNRDCDSRGMRANQPFLNHLFDNTARNANVLESNTKREALLVDLEERLSELLKT